MGGRLIIFEIQIVHYDRFNIVIGWKHKDKYEINFKIWNVLHTTFIFIVF